MRAFICFLSFDIQCHTALLSTTRPPNQLMFTWIAVFNFSQSSSTDLHNWQSIITRLSDYLLTASPSWLPLKYFSEKPQLEIKLLFADTEPTIQRLFPKGHKLNKWTVHFRKPGRVNKIMAKTPVSLQYNAKFTFVPSQFSTSDRFFFEAHLHKAQHINIFSKYNFSPWCTFCKFRDNVHNF